MQEVLSQSLNTGVAFITGKMGNKKLREYFLDKYKMGEETGIDLPGEVAGLVSNLDSPRDIEYMTASFGQGIALTPIATVRALATLANGGKLVQPHIVKKIRYKTGLSKTFDYTDEIEQVLKPESAEEVTRMLVKVVDEVLAGGKEKMEHYSIGVKTGTAQIAKPRGGYYEDRYLHSYFGYGPAYDAKFIVFLMTIEPKQAKYASQTLTEPFMDIMKYLLNYYDVPPDR
jgi:cell division protein FtsI (penicillin-binding protein 3)/stage V sporulation protein D (sporulation-specific penicillin-binding protein)